MKLIDSIIIDRPPYHWVIKNEAREIIQSALVGQEHLLFEQAKQEPLKDNNARTLFTMVLPDNRKVFIKRYKLNHGWPMLKAWLLGSKARLEYQMADYLKSQEVLTVSPLAVLEKRELSITTEAFLILEHLDNCVNLKDTLVQPQALPARKQGLTRLANFIKQIQGIGFLHKDLHIGNVLVDVKAPVSAMFYLIDLHRSKAIRKLSKANKNDNLAQISYSLWGVRPFTDVVRFLREVRSDLDPPGFRSFLRYLTGIIAKLRHRHWKSRTKRCLKSSTGFSITPAQGYRIFARRNLTPESLVELVRKHLEQVEQKQNLVKYSTYRAISRVNSVEINDGLVKEYRYTLVQQLKNLFRMHRARKSWLAANGFRVRQIPTPINFALLESTKSILMDRSFIIIKEIKDAQPLDEYVKTAFSNGSEPAGLLRRKKEFIKDLAGELRRMHLKGVFHYDMKANNILVQQTNHNRTYNFLDLDRISFSRGVSLARRFKNLAQINASIPSIITRTDRLRFYNYFFTRVREIPDQQKKRSIRKLMRLTIKRRDIWPGNNRRDAENAE